MNWVIIQIPSSQAKAPKCVEVFEGPPSRSLGAETLSKKVDQMIRDLFSNQNGPIKNVVEQVISKFSEPLRGWENFYRDFLNGEGQTEFSEAHGTYVRELTQIADRRKRQEIDRNEAIALFDAAYVQFFKTLNLGRGLFRNEGFRLIDRLLEDSYNDALEFVATHEKGLDFWNDTIVDPQLAIIQTAFDLTDHEVRAKNSYIADSEKFNKPLRLGRRPHKYDPGLRSALGKIDPFEGVVFRDAGHIDSDAIRDAYLTPGSIVSDKGFLSTSRSYTPTHLSEKSADEPQIFMVIRSRSGRSIENMSDFSTREREVLFLPDIQFRVVMVMEGPHNSYTVFLDELPEQ
ncbi:MAG: hypothetical protein AAF203_04640 [Pseudomonadota bacterium]